MMKTLLAAAAVLALAAPAYADVTYGTSNNDPTDLGGANGDSVLLGGTDGVFTGPGTYAVNNVSFFSGRFAVTPDPIAGTFSNHALSSAGNFTYTVDYSLQFSPDSDTLTLGGNSFQIEGYNILINQLVLGTGDSGVLTATVSAITNTPPATGGVPEPATWAMMLTGFGGLGAVLRRRRLHGAFATV
jgi:opacity protein-like surface antigen